MGIGGTAGPLAAAGPRPNLTAGSGNMLRNTPNAFNLGASMNLNPTTPGVQREMPVQMRGEDWLGTPNDAGAEWGQQHYDELLGSNTDLASLMAQMGMIPGQQNLLNAQLGMGQTGAYNAFNTGQQYLGLDAQGNAIQQADLAAQLGFIGRREGLSDAELANQLAGFGIDEETAKRLAATEGREINNRAAAGGAWFSPETRLDRSDSQAQKDERLRQIGLGKSNAQLGRQRAQIGYDQSRQSIDTQRQMLDLAASRLGVDGTQLQNQLNDTLNQLGIGHMVDSMTLFSQYGQMDAQQRALLNQIAAQAGIDLEYVAEQMGWTLNNSGAPPAGSNIDHSNPSKPMLGKSDTLLNQFLNGGN